MATTLEQEMERATDPVFIGRVRAALYRRIPNVIGETGVAALALAKRHTWACEARDKPEVWGPRMAAMLAGEPAVQAFNPPQSNVSEAVIDARLNALINDAAGVLATDLV